MPETPSPPPALTVINDVDEESCPVGREVKNPNPNPNPNPTSRPLPPLPPPPPPPVTKTPAPVLAKSRREALDAARRIINTSGMDLRRIQGCINSVSKPFLLFFIFHFVAHVINVEFLVIYL